MGREVEGGSGWGIHANPWLIHVNVWQKPLQYCKVISLQLIKINEKEMKETIVKINKTRRLFFEKINKIDKSLARLIKKKKERRT